MISILRSAAAAAFAVAAAATSVPAVADQAAEARALQVATNLVNRAHAVMISSSGTSRINGVQSAVSSGYSIAHFERTLLSSEARARFSDAQRAEFRRLLPRYLASQYVDRFGMNLSQPPAIQGVRSNRSDVLVTVLAPRPNGRTLPVQWRMRNTSAGPRVIDAITGGVSFVLTTRSEWSSVVRSSGADALLAIMRREISSAGG